MLTCPNCGHENEGAPKFCGECGSKLPEAPKEGNVQAGGVADNVISRSRVDASQTSAPASIGGINVTFGGVPSAPQMASTPTTLEFCAACGKPMPVPERKCPECGKFVCEEHFVAAEFICRSCVRMREGGVAHQAAEAAPMVAGAPRSVEDDHPPAEITEHDIELVQVSTGPSMVGSGKRAWRLRPVRAVSMRTYFIGKYPVTNAQYREFAQATGYRKPVDYGKEFSGAGRPVVGVNWFDASNFCRWLSRETGEDYHLPTEAEWEKAARGTDLRRYPWGDGEPTTHLCNFDDQVGHTTNVGTYPEGVSPYGCYDMAGNVWEWCDGLHYEFFHRTARRVLRGGCWGSPPRDCRSASRFAVLPGMGFWNWGFRVARGRRWLSGP